MLGLIFRWYPWPKHWLEIWNWSPGAERWLPTDPQGRCWRMQRSAFTVQCNIWSFLFGQILTASSLYSKHNLTSVYLFWTLPCATVADQENIIIKKALHKLSFFLLYLPNIFFTWTGNFVLAWIKCDFWLFVYIRFAFNKNRAPKRDHRWGAGGGRWESPGWSGWLWSTIILIILVAALSQERCCFSDHLTAKQDDVLLQRYHRSTD